MSYVLCPMSYVLCPMSYVLTHWDPKGGVDKRSPEPKGPWSACPSQNLAAPLECESEGATHTHTRSKLRFRIGVRGRKKHKRHATCHHEITHFRSGPSLVPNKLCVSVFSAFSVSRISVPIELLSLIGGVQRLEIHDHFFKL